MEYDSFYYCNLDDVTNNFNCIHKNECKRWLRIKDKPYNEYKDHTARLFNICRETNYRLFLKENVNESKLEEKTGEEEHVHHENTTEQ